MDKWGDETHEIDNSIWDDGLVVVILTTTTTTMNMYTVMKTMNRG